MDLVIPTFFLCFILYTFIDMLNDIYKDNSMSYGVELTNRLFEERYISNVKLLGFFSEGKNYNRLDKILDNNNDLIDKIDILLKNNKKIGNEYLSLVNEKFNFNSTIKYDLEINHKIFRTNFDLLTWIFTMIFDLLT